MRGPYNKRLKSTQYHFDTSQNDTVSIRDMAQISQ